MDQIIGAIGIVTVIIAALLMARRDLRAFPMNLGNHALWFANGWLTENWALVILNVVLTGLTSYTWWNFTRNKQWK